MTIQKKTPTLTDLEMEEEAGLKEVNNEHDEKGTKDEIFTKIVRAGKRTYFFDVKATKKDDYYLTITESKKRLGREGKVFYEKHKIFLYKEDFEKFSDGLKNAVNFIERGKSSVQVPGETHYKEIREESSVLSTVGFADIEFDDLGKK